MEENKNKLKACGNDTIIYPLCKIAKPEVIEIGHHCKIDDFVFIFGGEGIKIGNYVHIASFVSIIGGGKLTMGNNSGIATGTRVITGTNEYKTGMRCSAASPKEEQDIHLGHIQIGDDVIIYANCVILPDINIGEGAVVGAGTLVNKDLNPWGIYIGSPLRKIGTRELLEELRK